MLNLIFRLPWRTYPVREWDDSVVYDKKPVPMKETGWKPLGRLRCAMVVPRRMLHAASNAVRSGYFPTLVWSRSGSRVKSFHSFLSAQVSMGTPSDQCEVWSSMFKLLYYHNIHSGRMQEPRNISPAYDRARSMWEARWEHLRIPEHEHLGIPGYEPRSPY